MNEITDYHKNRQSIDFNYIEHVFIKQEREYLESLQKMYPNHIIKMPNHDLISNGRIKGYGGSVPYNWNGLTYQAK